MQTTTKQFYDDFDREIEICVEGFSKQRQNKLVNEMRRSVKTLANTKMGAKGGLTVHVYYKIDNKYFKETLLT